MLGFTLCFKSLIQYEIEPLSKQVHMEALCTRKVIKKVSSYCQCSHVAIPFKLTICHNYSFPGFGQTNPTGHCTSISTGHTLLLKYKNPVCKSNG